MRKPFVAALAASLTLVVAGNGRGQEVPSPTAAGPGQQPGILLINPKSVSGPVGVALNQQLADAIAVRLRQSPLLKHYQVTVTVQDGEAELGGIVQTPAQRTEVLRIAQSVPGVLTIRDHLQVMAGSDLVQAQAVPMVPSPFQPIPPLPLQGAGQPKRIEPVNPMQPFPPPPQPVPGPGFVPEPMPLHGSAPGFPSGTQPPPMPPNAWPTYAPYNNYSRVAYPTLYPYESFPFIGPIYPFPRVPLGWRSVSLTWEDGHWWFGRNATGHDWWRIRYW